MVDGVIQPGEVRDPWEKNAPGLGLGRDPCRTPLQWSDAPGAGFTQGRPWLPIAANATECNVAAETADPRSMLSFHRRLIQLRGSEDALMVGAYRLLEVTDHTLVFERRLGDRSLAVALNFAESPQRASLKGPQQLLLSTHAERQLDPYGEVISLAPFEGIVIATRS
jgi:alpha-glucosidase